MQRRRSTVALTVSFSRLWYLPQRLELTSFSFIIVLGGCCSDKIYVCLKMFVHLKNEQVLLYILESDCLGLVSTAQRIHMRCARVL